MSARSAFAALVLATACVLPSVAFPAIVAKWQTVGGPTYKVLARAGVIDDEPVYKLITGEIVGATERIGVRSGTTGGLLAQTVAST